MYLLEDIKYYCTCEDQYNKTVWYTVYFLTRAFIRFISIHRFGLFIFLEDFFDLASCDVCFQSDLQFLDFGATFRRLHLCLLTQQVIFFGIYGSWKQIVARQSWNQ